MSRTGARCQRTRPVTKPTSHLDFFAAGKPPRLHDDSRMWINQEKRDRSLFGCLDTFVAKHRPARVRNGKSRILMSRGVVNGDN
jgi:hypothetical protein